ncbi:MAG: polysaccharide biosynthesis tyrosine autokinase [Elainella sp. Prado103]|nr:polysaccharide biosynthesis tyrosine autokinase [Elainella sp. Prado103]
MDVQTYWLILKRRWLPATLMFAAIMGLSVAHLNAQEPIYRAQGKLRFTRDVTPSITGVGEEQGEVAPLFADNNPISTEMGVIRSIPTVQATIDQLQLKDGAGNLMKPHQFLNRLSLTAERGTDLLEIAYLDPDPRKAESVVNVLMKTYLEKHLQENRAQTIAARQFIKQQLPTVEANVRQAEAALRQFKQENQVASLEEEESAIVGSQETLRRRITDAKAELADANAQSQEFYRQLQMNPQEAIAATALSQSPGVQEALTQLQTIESQLSIERVRFYDAHPVISDLEARRANVLALLNQRVDQTLQNQARPNANLQIGELRAALAGDFVRSEIRRQGLSQQLAILSNAQDFYQRRIAALPQLEQEQRELMRQLEASQSTYSLLLSRLYEVQVAENQNVGNARIIQSAYILEQPVAPRPLSHFLLSGIIATIAALATALALEATDKSIRTVKEAREQFGVALLGVIPFHRGLSPQSLTYPLFENVGSSLLVNHWLSSPMQDAFQVLRANLKGLCAERVMKTIAVTSAAPHEGKSFVAAHLAMVLAQSGQRVLLVDANLRSPGQDKLWNQPGQAGLSNLIAEAVELSELIHQVAPNLDLLTTGTIVQDSTTILDSPRMSAVMGQLASHYDLVMIDTPSLGTAVDAILLGHLADGVMLVTRPGYMDVVNANIAKERLDRLNHKVLGQVINGVFDKTEPYRYRDQQGVVLENNGHSQPAILVKN